MRLACSTLTFSRLPLPAALRRIASLGFAWVDLGMQEGWAHVFPSQVREDPARVAAEVGALLAEAGLSAVAANVGLAPGTAGEQEERVDAVCRVASSLGIGVLTLPAASPATEMSQETARLRRLVAVAARRRVKLTVETHVGTWAESPEGARYLIQAVPGLGLTFDPTHILLTTGTWRLPEDLWPHVAHVHLRDTGTTPEEIQVAVGKGRIPHVEVLAQLRARGYEGAVSTEVIDTLGGLDAEEETLRLVRVLEGAGLGRDAGCGPR